MPQMMLMARKRIHPRELTYLPYETWTNEIPAVADAGVEPNIKILDAEAKTAVAAAQQLGCEVGAIANSLVFDCDGEPLLVLASGADRVDTELLARALGAAAINKANPQFVRTATGHEIEGVAPT